MATSDIEKAISEITKALSGYGLSDLERRLLHEDRKDIRAALAKARGEDRSHEGK